MHTGPINGKETVVHNTNFEGDFSSVLKKTFYTARLAYHLKTQALIILNDTDELQLLTLLMVVHFFRFIYHATYVG